MLLRQSTRCQLLAKLSKFLLAARSTVHLKSWLFENEKASAAAAAAAEMLLLLQFNLMVSFNEIK